MAKIRIPRFNISRYNSFFKTRFAKTTNFVQRRPFASFFASLLVLLVLILASNFLFKAPAATTAKQPVTKDVQLYTIGEAPKFTTEAQIQKTGVITINALSGGVVQQINVSEGQTVGKGDNLIQLASNYDGSNAPGIQTAIAQNQYQLAKDTLQNQKDIIQKQRDIANTNGVNAQDLQAIANDTRSDTQSLVDLNNALFQQIDQSITSLSNLPGATAAAQLDQANSLKLQLQSGLVQSSASLRNLQYQADPNKPPSELAALQKDLALKQLDVQEKTLENSVEIARLQLSLAAVSASLLHPVSPFNGTIEKVLVRPGESVAPGAPLFIINGDQSQLTAVALVSQKVAKSVSTYEDSVIYINNSPILAKPSFVSDVATAGNLYSVIFQIPDEYSPDVTDNSYINVEIPLGYPDSGSAIPFIPLDSVYQTQDASYVLVDRGDGAKSVPVTLGDVYGEYVEVNNGLSSGDKVIVNRNVLEGDRVKATN